MLMINTENNIKAASNCVIYHMYKYNVPLSSVILGPQGLSV